MQSRDIIELVVTIISSLVASSGLWLYIMKKNELKALQSRLLLGLAHDRIVFLGMIYIERQWISQDEYENLREFLYKPYADMGGNGAAKRVMDEVDKLPIKKTRFSKQPEKLQNGSDS